MNMVQNPSTKMNEMNDSENSPQQIISYLDDEDFLASLKRLVNNNFEFVGECLIPCHKNDDYLNNIDDWKKIQESLCEGNIAKPEFESWVVSQAALASRPPVVLETLIQLQEQSNVFDTCTITLLVPKGNGVLELDHHLQVSIFRLSSIDSETLKKLTEIIAKLPSDQNSTEVLGSDKGFSKRLINSTLRLRLEVQRAAAVKEVHDQIPYCEIRARLNDSLEPYEKDRLYTCVCEIQQHGGLKSALGQTALKFAAHMEPKTVSELAAYAQYTVCKIMEAATIVMKEQKTSRADSRLIAANRISNDLESLRKDYKEKEQIVIENNFVGKSCIEPGLGYLALITAIRELEIKFGANHSAVYHIVKHPVNQIEEYIAMAQETIRYCEDETTAPVVSLNQEGDAQIITFDNVKGRAIILGKDGKVFLMSFMPKRK